MAVPKTQTKAKPVATKTVKPVAQVQPVLQIPKRMHPTSRVNRIVALECGASLSEAVRIDPDHADKDTIKSKALLLKSAMSKAADTATRRSGFKFITEVGEFRTRSEDIMLVAVVTRLP